MKTFLLKSVSFLMLVFAMNAFGQDLQTVPDEVSESWKSALEKLTQPHQTPLADLNASSMSANGDMTPPIGDVFGKAEKDRKAFLASTKSAELSRNAWQKQMEEFDALKNRNAKRFSTDQTPEYGLNKVSVASETTNKKSDDRIKDDFDIRLRQAIHERNLEEQKRRIEKGIASSSSKRVVMGPKTSLEIDEEKVEALRVEAEAKLSETLKKSVTGKSYLNQSQMTDSKNAYENWRKLNQVDQPKSQIPTKFNNTTKESSFTKGTSSYDGSSSSFSSQSSAARQTPEKEVLPFTSDVLVGSWKIEPVAGALSVGPAQGDGSWWSNTLEEVDIRSCYFDDEWTFDESGFVSLDLQGFTWLETWQTGDTTEYCGTPIAPFDGSGEYFYFASGNDLTVEGEGIYLGLSKVYNGGELSSLAETLPTFITYTVTEYSLTDGLKRLTLDIEAGTGVWWRFKLVDANPPPTPQFLEGNWTLAQTAGAFGVGPTQGSMDWFMSTEQDLIDRACQFDDVWTFDLNGGVSLDQRGDTWLEPWQSGFEGCGTPVSPHDGAGAYNYFLTDNILTVEGQGMYLGVAKAFNGGELTAPDQAPTSISYIVSDFYTDGTTKYMTLDIDVSAAQDGTTWWRFNLANVEETSTGGGTGPSNEFLAGDWTLASSAGAFGLGPFQGSMDWFANTDQDVIDRACQFDDVWTFNVDGGLSLDQQGDTWLEPWQSGFEGCGTPVAPHDGSGVYSYFVTDNILTVEGQGMYLGLAKAFNGGELTSPDQAPTSISYVVSDFYNVGGMKYMTLDIDISAAQDGSTWWRFNLESDQTVQLVANGDFESGADGWSGNAVNVQFDGANSYFYADVATAGNPWDVNISQVLELTQGTQYLLQFDAATDFNTGTRTIIAGLGMNVDPFDAVTRQVTLNSNPQTYSLVLTPESFGGVDSRVLFDLGAETGVVILDNISLIEYGNGEPAQVDVDPDDYNALIEIRNSLGGDLLYMWMESLPASSWEGVDFNENGKVTGLFLDQTGLSGNMPAALTTLDQLSFLSLGGNDITGLPEGMGTLTQLEQIWLWSNQLSSLPADFFTGLSQTNIFSLDISGNRLEGMVDAGIGGLQHLRYLDIKYNQFTGLPDEIGNLDSLETFYLNSNNLQSLPATLVDLDMLREFIAWENPANSADVSVFFGMDSLRVLDVYNNNLTGTLDGIEASPRLEYIYMGSNDISGGIPSSISALTRLLEFRVHDNSLDGTLAAELFELPNLYQIELYNNNLIGAFPDTQGSEAIASIALGGNNLETLGAAIGNFPNMSWLDLRGNNFSGPLPAAIALDTALNHLNLGSNQFTGGIPVEWTSGLTNLRYLYLSDNALDAPIPLEIGNMNLINLAIDRNFIPGELPETLANLVNMGELYIWSNELTGIPDIRSFSNLYAFYAFDNYLEFDDFEPIMQMPVVFSGNFGISPQYEPEPTIEYVTVGQEVLIDATVGGSQNHYSWYFNGNYMEAVGDTAVLSIPAISLETAGNYWCEISNDSVTWASDLYLSSGERNYWISAPIAESDSSALVDIFEATNGENWNNPINWTTTPVAMWQGVFIENGRVTRLDLYNQNLQGGLPPSVGDLDALEWVSLFENPGMGYLPGEFFGLTNIHYLDVDNVGLTEISPDIAQLSALDTLWLGRNPMEGSMPKEIFSLTNLKLLGLYGTNFQGELPSEISQLSNLEALWLNDNADMFGDLPEGFSSLNKLKYLNLSYTPFSGGFEQIGSFSNLEWLYLYGSPAVEIELPDEFVNLTRLENLGVGYANYEIKGVPDEIFQLERLKRLSIVQSNVNNAIPAGFSNLDSLILLNLTGNGFGTEISGAFPTDFKVDSLQAFYVGGNNLTSLPPLENAPNLQFFRAWGNKLDFDDLMPLYDYFLSHENYTDYDVSYMQSPERTYIELSVGEPLNLDPPFGLSIDEFSTIEYYQDDEFIGYPTDNFGLLSFEIPEVSNPESDGYYDAYIFHEILTPITDLSVHLISQEVQVVEDVLSADSTALSAIYTHFEGQPEDLFGNWSSDNHVENWNGVLAYGGRVVGLNLYGLQGTIPGQSIAALDELKYLNLADGNLTGSIPAEIHIPGMEFLDLGRNQLTGSIPDFTTESDTSLYFLGLAGNFLSGSIPASLGNFNYLSDLYLDNNNLTGAIPSSLTGLYLGGFSVDRNQLSDIPEGLAFALENAYYVNFEANNFDINDMINGSGNFVPADNSYEFQGSTRMISWTGDANIGGQVTLSAERHHPADEFFWYRKDKYNEQPYYTFIGYTGTDSSIAVNINGEWAQTTYMAAVTNTEYKYGEYPFLTSQTPVDTFNKRFVTAQVNAINGVLGLPDSPPTIEQEFGPRYPDHTLYQNSWDANPSQRDTINLSFENDPIPINYVRLYGSTGSLGVYGMTLFGTGGESLVMEINQYISSVDQTLTFPKTTFAVNRVELRILDGNIDAFEIGDNGQTEVEIPVLDDAYTDVGPDYINIDVIYNSLADYILIERSTDGETFEQIASIGYTGWFRDEVVPGKYYYRARAVFESAGVTTGYSNVLETGNCEPVIPGNKIWTGVNSTYEDSNSNLLTNSTSRDEVFITSTGNFGEVYISDMTAGWFDSFNVFDDMSGILKEKCDKITGYTNSRWIDRFEVVYEDDTLYIEWWNDLNGIHVQSKYWQIGDQPVPEIELQRPYNLQAALLSKQAIQLTWMDDANPDSTEFIIQRSIGTATNFEDIDTVVAVRNYRAINTLDGGQRIYRVLALYKDQVSYPSNEARITHKSPLFDFLENTVTKDITRTSYGGAWGDFDADGDDDLYVSNAFDFSKNFLYENTGNGTFRKVLGTAATAQAGFTRTAAWGDYNNDGFLDIYSPEGRWDGTPEGTEPADDIYRNSGSKSFVKANDAAMAQTIGARSEGGVWVDLNNDGWLDLVKSTGFVLLNDGTGILTPTYQLEISEGPLPSLPIVNWTVSNVDIENDGDQDIYITGDYQNMLFLNDGTGQLTYTENVISNPNIRSRGFVWADFDNDGWMDLITGETDMQNFGIYRNMGGGEFVFLDATDAEEDDGFVVGRGYTVADFNNDGLTDVILNVEGRASLALNEGFFNFVDVPISDQAFPVTNSFSHVSVADFNQDGYVDVFLPNQDPQGGNYMFLNNATQGNSWITVNLKGIKSNRSGIGARVLVTANDKTQTQQIMSQNGLGSGNSLAAEFGLGVASIVQSIEVFWPSGEITRAENVNVNQLFTMVEVPESVNAGPTVNESDSTILGTLYEDNGGENWLRNQGWGEGSPLAWEGTFWSNPAPDSEELPRLLSLILNDNNLTDTIPPSITGLTELEVLDLSGNSLSGPIPSTLGNMTSLVNLSLNDNDLTGKIPTSVGTLANLENLDLYNNQLFGELPRSLGGLQQLKQFEIYNNDFIGFVPAEIGSLANLEVLRMEHNEFEGALPADLGKMESLVVLYLNDNSFTGELPADLGNLSNLLDLRIYNNEFFGQLPQTFSQLTGIEYVDISNNMLEGSLEVFATHDTMYYFNAAANMFTAMGDYTNNSADTVIVINNWLDFGDLDPNELLILRNRLAYNPQDSLYEQVDSLHAVGEQIIIAYDIAGSGNTYNWKLNGEPLVGDANVSIEGSSVDIIAPDTPNEGEYVLEVTNDNYPGMVLVTRPWNLKLTSLERDKRALLAFKEAVQNTYDLSSWTEGSTDLSSWVGVGLNTEGDRVISLNLPATETQVLKGNIPASFADLSGLVTLNLNGNELSRLPDISKWSSIQSIDVRRNRLKFGSLIPNVKLGEKITYIPQRRFGETEYDTLTAGDDPRLIVENQGFGATYQWKFGPYIPGQFYNNDVTDIQDANSRVYQIEDLDYDKMGTYRVEATHPNVPGLTLQSRNKNIMAATTVFGTVYADDQGTLLTNGEVISFRKTPTGPFVAEDTVAINPSGEYEFADVVLGDFLVLTKPNRITYPNDGDESGTVIDTYYEKADLYENASTLEVRQKSEGVDIEMVFYTPPVAPEPTGADFDGELYSDIEEDSLVDEEARILARKKVKRAACSMRRYVGSGRVDQDDSEFELYAYVESDDDGNFNFTDVREGLYRLNIQYPGVPMDPESDIEFEVGGDKENQLFTLVAVIGENGISVEAEEVLYTIKPYIKDVQLYPNPTEGKMKADFLVYRKINDLKMTVSDTRGVTLFEQQLSHRMGVQSTEIDLTDYESGVYFVEFTDKAGTFRHQVKVSKK